MKMQTFYMIRISTNKIIFFLYYKYNNNILLLSLQKFTTAMEDIIGVHFASTIIVIDDNTATLLSDSNSPVRIYCCLQ